MELCWDKETNRIDLPTDNHSKLNVVKFDHGNKIMVTKCEGHSASGTYYPAEFIVWKVNKIFITSECIFINAFELVTIPCSLLTYCLAENMIENSKEEGYLEFSNILVRISDELKGAEQWKD